MGQLIWSTDKDVRAYLSNRPAVLCFQGNGAERTGSKIRQSGEQSGCSLIMVMIVEMNESEPSLKCRK